ncbi:MAG: TonB-dependent receptor [Rubrivivax sp.]|nr:TonB-dependent receptor [Rubrivivax sp.]
MPLVPSPTPRTLAACLLLATSPAWVAAQGAPDQGDAAPAAQPGAAQRIEVVGRQGASDLRRAASVAKQVYGREELDKFGDTNVLDVMRRLPGVSVAGGGARMRGLGAGFTQILINGDRAPPGFQLDQLAPNQVERIEVLRAPTADTSAQAVAGTINIILKDAPRRSERQLRVGFSDGLDRPKANVNATFSDAKAPWAFTVPLSVFEWQRESRNTLERRAPGTDGQPALAVQQGLQENWGWGFNVGPRLNWKFSDEENLSISSFLQKGWWNNRNDFANTTVTGLPVLDDNSRADGTWQNLRGNAVWNYRFANDQRIELRAGVQQSRGTFDSRNLRLGVEQLRTVGGSQDEGVTQAGKYSRLLGEAHSLTAGWDLEITNRDERRTTTRNGALLSPEFDGQPFDARVQRRAFYVQDEWEISPQLQTVIGLRHERIETESKGAATTVRNTSSVLSPLWHLTWRLDPKGRDIVRASVARTYRAPNVGTLLARPAINALYLDTSLSNTELAPDRIGNPALRPELSTGLDIAFEKYMAAGGIWSVGVFHRKITDLTRTVTLLQNVSWATAPRWVAQPRNFSSATTRGLEFEIKGRASELMPKLLAGMKNTNLRASLNFYRSSVEALPGPDNRLDGQQPWTSTLGFDHRVNGTPLNFGGSLTINPAYDTRLLLDQVQQRSSTKSLDLFAQWVFKPGLSMRVAANAGSQPFGPTNSVIRTVFAGGDYTQNDRYAKPTYSVTLDMRL